VIERGIDQGGAIPEQGVSAIPGSAATDLLRDATGPPVKSERAIGAARILKTDGAKVELVISVDVVGGDKLLESVFLEDSRVGSIGTFRRGAFLGRCALTPAGKVGRQQRRSGVWSLGRRLGQRRQRQRRQ
jgi:hypothetical protein